MTKKSWLILAAAATVGVLLVAVLQRRSTREPQPASVVTVGAILPLTGSSASLGVDERRGLESARDILERETGLTINMVFEDGKNDAKESINAFVKLWRLHKPQAVIVTHSGQCAPVAEYVSGQTQSSLPLIMATMTSADVTLNNSVVVRVYPSGHDEAFAMAAYSFDTLKTRRIAVLAQNDDYGLSTTQYFSRAFSEKGGHVTVEETFPKDGTDHRSLVTRIRNLDAQAVFVVGNTTAFAYVIRQLREQRYPGQILAGPALEVERFRTIAGPEAIRGVYYLTTFAETPALQQSLRYKSFKELLKTGGATPNLFNTYPALSLELLLRAALKAENRSGPALARFVTNNTQESLIGPVRFDSRRNGLLPVSVKIVHDGDPQLDPILETYTRH